MTAINTMVKRVSGLLGTRDITAWEERFIRNIVQQTQDGRNTSSLTDAQIVRLEEIFHKHFAG